MHKIERYNYLKPIAFDPEVFANENRLLYYNLRNYGIFPPFICGGGIFVTGSWARAIGFEFITGRKYPYCHHDLDLLTIRKSRVYKEGIPIEMRRNAARGVEKYLQKTQFNLDQVLTNGGYLFATQAFVDGMCKGEVRISESYLGASKVRDGVWRFKSQKGIFRFILFRAMWGELGFTFPEIDVKEAKQLIHNGLERKELEKYVKGSQFYGKYEEFKKELSALGLTV